MDKTNYVIATWGGPRRLPNTNYIKDHLSNLLKLKNNLTQITIVKPLCHENDITSEYYNIEHLTSQFNCEVVVLEKPNNSGHSYGQLFHTYQTYGDKFDYYIFVEDDYVVDIDYFDSILINELGENSYLCSKASDIHGFGYHASVSNGIISQINLDKLCNNGDILPLLDLDSGWKIQLKFSELLTSNGISIIDYSDKYSTPYFGHDIEEHGNPNQVPIFIPHQMVLNYDRPSFRLMVENDLPLFLEVRNQSTEYLHNNNKFTLEESIKWFKESKPKYYIITVGVDDIGYFRTSNWVDGSMYLGCDIHPKYRGLGLGQKSYRKFINELYFEHGINHIQLEVLETNLRAIHLYTKLGFIKIGESKDKVIKDGKKITSIIMEHNR